MNANIRVMTAIDLEMNQPSGSIIQIGAVIGDIKTGEILKRMSVFVNNYENVSPYIQKLTGIRQSDVDSGLDLVDAYNEIAKAHKNLDSFINPITWGGGDSILLLDQLNSMGGSNFNPEGWVFGRRWIDAKTLYFSLRLANGESTQGGLARAMTKVGLRFNGRKHNAMYDAENTFRIYSHLISKLKAY